MSPGPSFRLGVVVAISLLATVTALAAQRWMGVSWFTVGLGPAVAITTVLLYVCLTRGVNGA